MLGIPSRESLAGLTEAARLAFPLVTVGFARKFGAPRVSVLYASPYGIGEFLLPRSELPDVLRVGSGEVRQIEATAFRDRAERPIEWQLISGGVQQVISASVPGIESAATFWMGLSEAIALTQDRLNEIRRLAAASAGVLRDAQQYQDDPALLRRLELSAGLVPALLRVLDVREVFERLSSISQAALPHDMLILGLFSDDLTSMEVYARTGRGSDVDRTFPQPYPPAVTQAWEFDIIDDRTAYPLERDRPPTTLGMRSSLRLPFKFEDRVIGGLAFHSAEVAKYSSADVIVGRRLADHIAAAVSHYRLAEEVRHAAALRERTANLEMLDGLLATLTGVLDIREVFDRVSAIADKVLPHDGLSIAEVIEPGDRVRIHASHGLGGLPEPYDLPVPDRTMLTEPWDYRLIADLQERPEYTQSAGRRAGMRSAMFVSIRLEGRLFGGLNFYSKTPGRYGPADVLVARRITDHVALTVSHRLLAEQIRRNEELRARAEKNDLLDDLLSALIDSGELPDVFGRISTIAAKVLPHDAAALMVRLPDGRHGRLYASSGFPAGLPEVAELPEELLKHLDWEHNILDNLLLLQEPRYAQLVTMGFQSLLRVPIRLDAGLAGALIFFSNAPGTFKQTDVVVARRMAERMAVTLARDREIQAARRADEATARASRLETRVRALTEELDARTGYRRVVGESAEWRQVLTQATQVAATETTVLLLGESGTGKEVVARFLHRASSRNSGPFIALNCAALPEQLLEAELFGYERGAYTGATQSKPGQLEQAAGGTLFLDEVGEMSPSAQAKFLRVLQEREFQRLGGTRVLRTDARIIAATNRDLQRAIANGQFREDLYYRLNVFAIRLPALRDRPADILPLSEAFLAEIGRGLGRPPGGISRQARKLLVDYHWPGNVRELRNILERAAILCDGGLITEEHLALNVAQVPKRSPATQRAIAAESVAPAAPAHTDLQSMERAMIEQALQNARFNKSKAASALGLTRHQLYVRMRKHSLE